MAATTQKEGQNSPSSFTKKSCGMALINEDKGIVLVSQTANISEKYNSMLWKSCVEIKKKCFQLGCVRERMRHPCINKYVWTHNSGMLFVVCRQGHTSTSSKTYFKAQNFAIILKECLNFSTLMESWCLGMPLTSKNCWNYNGHFSKSALENISNEHPWSLTEFDIKTMRWGSYLRGATFPSILNTPSVAISRCRQPWLSFRRASRSAEKNNQIIF